MNKVNYNHNRNMHSTEGPQVLLPEILKGTNICSLLDVGAGKGTWLAAAKNHGLIDIFGIDGIKLSSDELCCASSLIVQNDLNDGFSLHRNFDAVICFEVAEHLPEASSHRLIESITQHTNLCFFGAAIPGQNGQGHINCQWPIYWQSIFNYYGFECFDDIRPRIWNMQGEPWYRQNIFRAVRSDNAGNESRILPLVHPEMVSYITNPKLLSQNLVMRMLNKFSR
jgi:hypothetical protein